MVESKDRIQVAGREEYYVPNANSLIFSLFPPQIKFFRTQITQENLKQVQELVELIYQFGGLPIVHFPNLMFCNFIPAEELKALKQFQKMTKSLHQCMIG